MRAMAGLLLTTLLTMSAACAQREDWIDRTLVTVDVTGAWQGTFTRSGGGPSGEVIFILQQQGAKVTRELK